jgi:hypothetical protein
LTAFIISHFFSSFILIPFLTVSKMTGAASLKLSSRLKALIALPAARGAAIPAAPAAKTRELLDRIRSGGEKGGVGRDTWLSLTTAAIFTVNSPETLCQLFDYASEGQDVAQKVQVAAVSERVYPARLGTLAETETVQPELRPEQRAWA